MFTCPVCFYPGLTEAPQDYNICDCCGTEFDNDDSIRSHEELRQEWIENGAPWFFGDRPLIWNPFMQLMTANIGIFPYSSFVSFGGGAFVSEARISVEYDEDTEYELQLAS